MAGLDLCGLSQAEEAVNPHSTVLVFFSKVQKPKPKQHSFVLWECAFKDRERRIRGVKNVTSQKVGGYLFTSGKRLRAFVMKRILIHCSAC